MAEAEQLLLASYPKSHRCRAVIQSAPTRAGEAANGLRAAFHGSISALG